MPEKPSDPKSRKRQWWERPEPEPDFEPQPVEDVKEEQAEKKGEPAVSSETAASHELTEQDIYLFHEGTHYQVYDKLGAHPDRVDGVAGTRFAVWAPNAEHVSVIGDWNDWDKTADRMSLRGSSGLWEIFLPAAAKGMRYKYHVVSRYRGYRADKADPFALYAETPPRQASVIWDLEYEWGDSEWMAGRGARSTTAAPMSIYEIHLGSWRRVVEEGNRSLTYREMAPLLSDHMKTMGFTHVEMMPVMEHPFFGSWGYQSLGYFAPSSRFGTPEDFMYLIDYLHQQGIGVILDWVPSHFPTDEHGLAFFDGTHLFEHADPRKGYHPDWSSYIFNYGRTEVRSFLGSSALFWLGVYHADALRVDAVASMLYLDYSRKAGEWIPNEHGGRENLESIAFLRALNERIYEIHPDVQAIAEESTAWPMVSRPAYVGGLGFGFKWDMGWMHDTLEYMALDPIHRKFRHNLLTFRIVYAFAENFVLPLSHDEVVHGKGSLYGKMAGDARQKLASLRLLYAYMFAQPGKKLLFMGAELGQSREWNHDGSLDWHLQEDPGHAGLQRWLADLNRLYREEPAFHELDCAPEGFEWIDCSDAEKSILALLRKGKEGSRPLLIVLNFTPVVRKGYEIGAPAGGFWREVLNSDAAVYGGLGEGNDGGVEAAPRPYHGRSHSLTLTLPALGAIFLMQTESAAAGETHQPLRG
jgi:1,4-alpha-glucan branching enzyme